MIVRDLPLVSSPADWWTSDSAALYDNGSQRIDLEGAMFRVGVIGLGNMGEGMAMNLVAKGFATTVFDIREEPVERLVALGATAASSAAGVGASSDVVIIAVFSASQVSECVLPNAADAGLIESMAAGSVICVTSTVPPSLIRSLADIALRKGVSLLDVAMSGGGDVAARAGALSFMAGGDRATVDRIRPVLDAMATTIHYVGPTGSGVTSKIVNNLLAVQNVATVREAMRLSRSLGFDEQNILDIVATAAGHSWVSNHWQAIRTQEAGHPQGKGGIAAMAGKDLHLALDLGHETGTPMPLLEFVVETVIPDLEARGMTGDRDA